MDRKKVTLSPSKRLKTGATILAAAQVVDTKPVQDRFDAFAKAHRSYCDAQSKVDAADAALRTAQTQLVQLDAEQDSAVEALALCLIHEGQPREKPFAAFSADAPGRIKAMTFAEEAQAIHTLVANVQRDTSLSPAALAAAQRAEQAAANLETALAPLAALRNTLSAARELRDTLAPTWDAALGVLRRGVAAASDDGAPGLSTALFGRRSRAAKKKPTADQAARPAANQQPTPDHAAAPAVPVGIAQGARPA